MRYLYLLALCACISLVACKKSKFIINGISDVKVMRDSSVVLPLAIEQDKGDQEQVTLTLSGLPANVEYDFSSAAGTPDFATVLTIKAKYNAAPGAYTIKIKGTNAAGYEKEYEMKVTVDNNDACRAGLYGTWVYTGTNAQWCGSQHPTIEISRDYPDNNRVQIKHLSSKDWVDTGRVSCSNNTIYLPYNFTGSFTEGNITFTAFDNSGDTCRYNYIRQ